MQPMRELTRQKNRQIDFIEATCMKIDHEKKELHLKDESEVTGSCSTGVLNYDYLVVATGAENATFNIPGVKDHACFLKESW
jgi:NADH:ubiquinone reductase (non-electrogenic)